MIENRKPIIGVMGPGNPKDSEILKHAEKIGMQIANRNWVLLTGGRKAGVMDAASKGASEAGGEVIGILPGDSDRDISDYVSIPIVTGVGSARNYINILSSDVVIVCGMGLGTSSEAALAMKHGKPTLFTKVGKSKLDFFQSLTNKKILFFDEADALFEFIEKNLIKD
ncbi:MAG: TIGR00725 family protein [Bacteroidetes bacterium]|jgi:uncharacterized protein (TIGR00725 family)|nr:TIGR00725 family protein [Bacteroidota bacterium]